MKVVTYLNDRTLDAGVLIDSCKEQELELIFLGEEQAWPSNAFKLKLLYDFLKESDKNDLYLIVDALDVYIHRGASEIEVLFEQAGCDIWCSAEANFYFQNYEIRGRYWKEYPRNGTVYDYLNSGSIIGKGQLLILLLEDIIRHYSIDFDNREQIKKLISDQYLISRTYSDIHNGHIQAAYSLKLDHYQKLFGCTAGRMTTIRWPLFSKIHSYLFFRHERKLLKTFKLEPCQDLPRDFAFDAETSRFINRHTATYPIIIHLPATRDRFRKILQEIQGTRETDKWDLLKPLAILVSFFVYAIILLRLPFTKRI